MDDAWDEQEAQDMAHDAERARGYEAIDALEALIAASTRRKESEVTFLLEKTLSTIKVFIIG